MTALIIEKDVRFEARQDPVFLHAAQEEGLVGADAPAFQGMDDAFMSRRIARGDNGRDQRPLIAGVAFQGVVLQVL